MPHSQNYDEEDWDAEINVTDKISNFSLSQSSVKQNFSQETAKEEENFKNSRRGFGGNNSTGFNRKNFANESGETNHFNRKIGFGIDTNNFNRGDNISQNFNSNERNNLKNKENDKNFKSDSGFERSGGFTPTNEESSRYLDNNSANNFDSENKSRGFNKGFQKSKDFSNETDQVSGFNRKHGFGNTNYNRKEEYNERSQDRKEKKNFDRYQDGNNKNNFRNKEHDGEFSNMRDPIKRTGEKKEKIEMRIPQSSVGVIIGKGGSKIKELQEETKTRINISSSDVVDGQTLISIFGRVEDNEATKQIILSLIEENNSRRIGSSKNNQSEYSGNNYRSRNALIVSNTSEYDQEKNRISESHTFGRRMNDDSFGNQQSDPYSRNSENGEIEMHQTLSGGFVPKVDWNKAKIAAEEYARTKWLGYPKIYKNFYKESQGVTSLTKQQVAAIRTENNNISVLSLKEGETEDDIPKPALTFTDVFHSYPDIMREIEKNGFTKPSPIQMQAWPIILSGRDLIGIAQTGTGKTLAFLLPAFIHIEGQEGSMDDRGGPNVLVMTPTRELAIQIESEVKKYKYHGIKCVCIYGGGSRKEQINVVTKGVQIVVATPGRLYDLISSNVICMKSVTYLVLDEADRMLDLGFEPEIRKCMIDIRPDRQTIMTSATWPDGVRRLATSFQIDPIQVFVGSLDLTAVHSVEQQVIVLDEDDKLSALMDFLRYYINEPDFKVIVFFARKATVDYIASEIAMMDEFVVQSIHGGREQCDREQALEELKQGVVKVLLATDVASRGIDVSNITHVVNYDFPKQLEEYVHRVGRTGRAGKKGQAITFMTKENWRQAEELIGIMEEASQIVPEELREMADRFRRHKEKRAEEEARTGYKPRGRGRGGRRNEFSFGFP